MPGRTHCTEGRTLLDSMFVMKLFSLAVNWNVSGLNMCNRSRRLAYFVRIWKEPENLSAPQFEIEVD